MDSTEARMAWNGGCIKIPRSIIVGIAILIGCAYADAGIIEDLPNYHLSVSGGPQGYYYLVDQDAPGTYPSDIQYYGSGYQFGIGLTHNLKNGRLGMFWERKKALWGREDAGSRVYPPRISEWTIGLSYLVPIIFFTWYDFKAGFVSTELSYYYKDQVAFRDRFTPGVEFYNGIIKEVGISSRLKLGIGAGISLSAHADNDYGFKTKLCAEIEDDGTCVKFGRSAFLGGGGLSATLSLIY